MITIQILNVTSTLTGASLDQQGALDQALSYFMPGAMFSPLYRKHRWDGRKHFFKYATVKSPYCKFPTGLVSRIINVLQTQYPEELLNVVDNRVVPLQQMPLRLPGGTLEDYQQEAVNKAVECSRGIFRLPTGAGKTWVEAALIARLNVPTLVMSHRIEILEHLQRTASKAMGFEIGTIQGSNKVAQRFNVAMIQTVKSAFDRAAINAEANDLVKFITEEVQCLIVDEAHHTKSDTYWQLSNRAFNAYYRFGFSATPLMGDQEDMLVEAGFGRLQMSMTPSDLILKKRLAKPYIFFVDYGDASKDEPVVNECHACHCQKLIQLEKPLGRKKSKKKESALEEVADVDMTRTVFRCTQCDKEWTTYQDANVRNVVMNQKRNQCITNLALGRILKRKTVLILVTHIKHGMELEAMLRACIPDPSLVEFVHGETEGRKDLLDDLATKRKLCLIATSVFGEGVDLPSLSTLIYARASASPIDVIQGVGRALRRAPGKYKTLVFDFLDKSDYFKKRSKFRKKLLSEEPQFVVKTLKKLI